MGSAPIDGKWVVQAESLDEMLRLHREQAEVIEGVIGREPNLGRWSQQVRLIFFHELLVGMSRMLSLWAFIDDVKLPRDGSIS